MPWYAICSASWRGFPRRRRRGSRRQRRSGLESRAHGECAGHHRARVGELRLLSRRCGRARRRIPVRSVPGTHAPRACSGICRGRSSSAEKINTGATRTARLSRQHAHEGREHRQRRARRAVPAHGSRRVSCSTCATRRRRSKRRRRAQSARSIGRNVLDFILTDGRAEVSAQAQELLQATLDSYEAGITIYEVNLVDAEFPGEVEVAVQDSIRAREDRERRILEAQTYSNDILPRARGEAERRRQDAEAYREQVIADAEGESDRFTQILAEYEKAPEVTRERIYIETLEEILRTSTKVLVDTEGGNNLLYLPLDQLVQRRSTLRPPSRGRRAFAPPPAEHAHPARATGTRRDNRESTHEPTHEFAADRRRLGRGRNPDVRVHGRCARARREVPDRPHRPGRLRARPALQDSVLRERRSLSEPRADLRRGLARAVSDGREEEPDRRLLRELAGR